MGLHISSVSNSIINFYDIERISKAISDTKVELEKLEIKLEEYRPKTGRTITSFSTGTAGFLPLIKRNDTVAVTAIADIKRSVETLTDQLAKEIFGYEKTFEAQVKPIKDLIQQVNNRCDLYTEEHQELKKRHLLKFLPFQN